MSMDAPAKKPTQTNTFVVRVEFTQNATWQGTVDWVNQNRKKPFRSALELLKIMDSAIESGKQCQEDVEIDAP